MSKLLQEPLFDLTFLQWRLRDHNYNWINYLGSEERKHNLQSGLAGPLSVVKISLGINFDAWHLQQTIWCTNRVYHANLGQIERIDTPKKLNNQWTNKITTPTNLTKEKKSREIDYAQSKRSAQILALKSENFVYNQKKPLLHVSISRLRLHIWKKKITSPCIHF